ncbi:MAG: hypothetical protein QW666_02640 [Candidatus Woesearchaeota archaeon]
MGDELKEHIKRQLSKGYKPEEIKKALIHVGFSSSEVREAFREFEPKKMPILHRLFKPKKEERKPKPEKKAAIEKKPATLFEPEKPPELPAKPEPKELPAPEVLALPPPPSYITYHRKMGVIIISILCIILIAAMLLFFVTPICLTESCFINAANECGHAKYKNNIKGTEVRFETEGCVLTKTIISLGPEEPEEIKKVFQGKSMTCRYQQNNFDPLYITSLTGLINTCEGELKEEIMKRVV